MYTHTQQHHPSLKFHHRTALTVMRAQSGATLSIKRPAADCVFSLLEDYCRAFKLAREVEDWGYRERTWKRAWALSC